VKLAKDKVNDVLQMLAKDANVLVPKNVDGVKKFAPLQAEGEIIWDEVNTLLPPKDSLFPQTEKMYKFSMSNQEVTSFEEVVEEPKTVLFGIRPCDVYSIACMDDVFFTKTYVDQFYKRKRENLLIVSIGCTKVAPTCFCDSMGLNPTNAPTADVMLNDLGNEYLVKAQTPKGEAAVAAWGSLLSQGEGEVTPVSCELKVDMNDIPEKLLKMFDHGIWGEVSRKCLGCGTCTYVCPTCYCFDIDAEVAGNDGCKFRCWDSCMFSEYSRMAGGHNPRPSKKERVRNRFLHKLAYFQDRYGKMLCVGCGRCVAKCPVNLDITCFIDKVKEVQLND